MTKSADIKVPLGAVDPNNRVVQPAKRRTSHTCGTTGGYEHHTKAPDPRGRPLDVTLTRAERYWIQSRIEKLGPDADPMERRLLDKVRVTP